MSSGWTRLTVVAVVLVELVLVAGTYDAWKKLSEAEQELASLPIPASSGSDDESLEEYFNGVANSPSDEIVRRSSEREARMHYEYATARIATKTEEFYLFIGSLFAFPLGAAVIYQVVLWVRRGFHKQVAQT